MVQKWHARYFALFATNKEGLFCNLRINHWFIFWDSNHPNNSFKFVFHFDYYFLETVFAECLIS